MLHNKVLFIFLMLLIGYGFIIKAMSSENPLYWIGVIAIGYPTLILFRNKNWQEFIKIMKSNNAPVWFNVLLSLTLFFLGYLVPARKVAILVGWVEPDGLCWVSYLNPTYENQASCEP